MNVYKLQDLEDKIRIATEGELVAQGYSPTAAQLMAQVAGRAHFNSLMRQLKPTLESEQK